MNFHLDVYSQDQLLGSVRVSGRYVHMLVGSNTYPMRSIEDACVALLAVQEAINANQEEKEEEATAEACG